MSITLNHKELFLEDFTEVTVKDLRTAAEIPTGNRVMLHLEGGRMRPLADDELIRTGSQLYHLPVPMFA